MAQLAADVEKEHLHLLVALLDEETGHGKGVAPLLPGYGDDHYALAGQETRNHLEAHGLGGTFHKLYAVYVLRLACGEGVQLLKSLRIEYLHLVFRGTEYWVQSTELDCCCWFEPQN